MDISKKELLEETGISYGQLYRWKREGLIPEAWFEKRSSYTGQETYFPRDEILKRIEMIQQLKDLYSLEELSKMLNPEHGSQMFDEESIVKIKELSDHVVAEFMDSLHKDEFTYCEIILMVAFSKCFEEFNFTQEEVRFLLQGMKHYIQEVQNVDFVLQLVNIDKSYYMILTKDKAMNFFDERIHILKEISLQDLSSAMKLKYQTILGG